jgi:hypothetical protein
MQVHRRLVVSLAAVGALAATSAPVASAHSQPSAAGVAAHAKRADRYIASFKRHVAKKHSRTAINRLAVARRETSLAAREARTLSATAVSPAQITNAMGAVALSADQYAQLLAVISELIDQVNGTVRATLSQVIGGVANAHNQLMQMLSQMLGTLPAPAQGPAAIAVSQVVTTGTTALAPMTDALAGGTLPVPVAGIVTTVFQAVSAALSTAVEAVKAVIPALPVEAAGPVSNVLTMVTGVLNSVLARISAFVPAPGGPSGAATSPAGLAGGVTGIVNGVMSSVSNLLGRLFGNLIPGGGFGFGAGSAPAAAAS